MNSSATRRMYRRISTECPAIYLTSSSFRRVVVRDISLNGFRIEGPMGVSRSTLVMVRLWLPDQEGSIDIDQAIVRWVNEREFGVQFVALSNEADLRIATHVEQVLHRMASDVVAC